MQQTLLALLSLLIVTLLSFNQQQARIQGQQQAIRAELQQMALGVGMQTMEVIRARKFDKYVAEVGGYTDPNTFSKPGSGEFGIAGDCKLHPEGDGVNCGFVESFDGTESVVPHPLPDSKTYPFNVNVEVRYVCSDLEPADESGACSAPTSRKEVVLKIRDAPSDGEPRLSQIRYSEVITYP